MQLTLSFGNERRFFAGIRAFVHESLKQFSLSQAVNDSLVQFVLAAVENALDHAYPTGEEGLIELTIHEEQGKLEIFVRDYGLPQDIATWEREIQSTAGGRAPLALHWPGADVVDEAHWIAYGRAGKALQIIKWLDARHIADGPAACELAAFRDDAPLAPEQAYTVRRMLPNEATQVSQLIYRAYGNTYFSEDVYYPERVAALNASGAVLSFVAAGSDGRLVGHYALERNQAGPVAEAGQAVVDPAHRGRRLMERMKDAALADAQPLGLAGWYADAVTVHTLTQKSNIAHGARLTCVDLAISPKSESFRNLSTELTQRVTCLLYFHPLQPLAPRVVYVPVRHRDIVAAIYANLECPTTFGEPTPPAGHGTLRVSIDGGAATAMIRAEELGADTVHMIRHAQRNVIEHSHAEVVYCELPLSDPGTPFVAETLESEGFGFLGVAPHFSSRGDVLRIAYLVEPLAREPIQALDDFSGRLVDYTLAEQSRAREGL